ncbi:hypothetical protein LOK49_LG07G03385 [Camellia lanceoleosa]|uniref:Uncharacterized protein n=1 Tax=Camellia lanceoleosa TaxID=1840588 RepID=A0ACC0H3C0_9ERIC|nr:hypothetical protein LOK49_LG07G03385 [Camellia lanceoleosa]
MGDSNSNSDKAVGEEVSRLIDSAKELQDSASSLISRTTRENEALRQRALTLDSAIRTLRCCISSLVRNGNLDPKEADKVTTTPNLLLFLSLFLLLLLSIE